MPVINEIGNKYGRLTVIERAPNDSAGRAHWICKCECGNTTIVRGTTLRSGATQSCGCLQKEAASKNGNNLIGQKFGRLLVIEQDKNNTSHRGKYWKCQCDCGKFTSVRGDQLTSGKIQSCGCLQREKASENKINEIGNKYGLLTVIDYYPSDNEGHARWKCKCDCGNIKVCLASNLRRGLNISCGCVHSRGEMLIAQLLRKYNIEYKAQYTFKDLCGYGGGRPRFDFAIFFNNKLYCLIEYQGEQHTDKSNFFYNESTNQNDTIKKNYCKKHNITLFELTKNDNLESFVIQLKERAGEG